MTLKFHYASGVSRLTSSSDGPQSPLDGTSDGSFQIQKRCGNTACSVIAYEVVQLRVGSNHRDRFCLPPPRLSAT